MRPDDARAHPLTWPIGWPRTPGSRRHRAHFKDHGATVSIPVAITRLQRELERLRADHELLSTNVPLTVTDVPKHNAGNPDDPGAAVYFTLKKQDLVLACDKWDRVADNITALAAHIDAIRRMDRYGVGRIEQAFGGYKQLSTGVAQWWDVLGLPSDTTLAEVEAAYKRLAKIRHPDNGGSQAAMGALTAARDAARVALAP